MKAPKTKSSITRINSDGITAIVDVRTGTKIETYRVEASATVADDFQVDKFIDGVYVNTHTCDTWNTVCDCDGFKNGFLCRHLRMVAKLQSMGKVK